MICFIVLVHVEQSPASPSEMNMTTGRSTEIDTIHVQCYA